MTYQTLLLTSGRLPITLAFARSLQRQGARVIVVDTIERFICQSSSAVSRSFILPSPDEHFEAYKTKLLRIIHDEKIDRIFPMGDDILHLSRWTDELPEKTEIFASAHRDLQDLINRFDDSRPVRARSCTVMDRGNILAHIVYETAVNGRESSLVVKEAKVPGIDDWIMAFAEGHSFHGAISFDFAVDAEGEVTPVKCCPWPSPGYLVMDDDALAEAILTRTVKDENPAKVKSAQVLLPTLGSLPSLFRSKNLCRALKEIWEARDVVFDRKDWGPALYQIHCGALLEKS